MRDSRDRLVAVTGVGIVSPIGVGRERFWAALCAGESGIAPIESFPVGTQPPRLAAEVRGFAARDFITSAHLRRMDKLSRMVVAASRMALDDTRAHPPPERIGVVVGSALGDVSESAQHLERVFVKGPAAASPMAFPNLVLNAPASYVSMELGITGPNLTVSEAESTGEHALVLGCDLLRAGRADLVLAGGGDELSAILRDIFLQGRALSSQRGGPEWSSPYDIRRNGIVLGEGAAMLALESLEQARVRGAAVFATIEDSVTFSIPGPAYGWPVQASGAVPVLRSLIKDDPVDLICGAGNSTREYDRCELDLLGDVFGDAASRIWLTSIKGAVGEFGAAGALSAAAASLALHDQRVPPLCNLRELEPAFPFRVASQGAVDAPVRRVLLCAIGRGGGGAALVMRRN